MGGSFALFDRRVGWLYGESGTANRDRISIPRPCSDGVLMKSRRKAREAAVQALYQCDTQCDFSRDALDYFMLNFFPSDAPARVEPDESSSLESHHKGSELENRQFACRLMEGAVEKLDDIDRMLSSASAHWSVARMSRVDRNILRIAAFELLFAPDVPQNVVINEAIELAKTFGSDESPMFINGVLDQVAKKTAALRAGGKIASNE